MCMNYIPINDRMVNSAVPLLKDLFMKWENTGARLKAMCPTIQPILMTDTASWSTMLWGSVSNANTSPTWGSWTVGVISPHETLNFNAALPDGGWLAMLTYCLDWWHAHLRIVLHIQSGQGLIGKPCASILDWWLTVYCVVLWLLLWTGNV